MKDYLIDYTWRVNGKEIVNCPVCKKHGVLRRQLDDDNSYHVVHRESPRLEDKEYYQEFCTITELQARKVSRQKEKRRLESLERNRNKIKARRVEDRKVPA